MDAMTLYESLSTQASQGGWINGFSLRDITTDPWGIGVFDPEVVLFEKPQERMADVDAAREVIFSLGRSMFIKDQSWDRLGREMTRLYNDPKVIEFLDSQQGNLFILTPHVQFHDLGIVAAKSLEVRQHLSTDHPLYNDGDPAHRQHIIANRVLTMLEHPLFTDVLGLPVLEGLMLAIADVVTTVSSNGSARLLRKLMGRDEVSALNAHTRSQVSRRSTHGRNIFFIAPSGSQARLVEVDAYSKALVIEEVSTGTSDLIAELNSGAPETRRNMVAGLFIDCPSLTPSGQLEPQDAGVALCEEVWVPTRSSQMGLMVRAMLRSGVAHGRLGGQEFRYASPDADPRLSRSQQVELEGMRLEEVLPSIPGHAG
ncbi:MAG: hypothetical protein WCI12_09715 [Actinomycetes bacterium]|jgi:hypothetical protein